MRQSIHVGLLRIPKPSHCGSVGLIFVIESQRTQRPTGHVTLRSATDLCHVTFLEEDMSAA